MDKMPVTQAMIAAYDEYTHLTLDRRGFMKKLQTLAGSAASAAAILPLLAANSAHAEMVPTEDPRLDASDVTFPGGSSDVKAYMVSPKDGPTKSGTVIVIHENRGLNGHIKDVARRIALEGFVALAPDFLSVAGGTPEDEDKARDMISALDRENLLADAKGAVAYLAPKGKVGAVGFCWGGGLVNQLAVADPDLVAGVAYYGSQPKAEQVPSIEASLLLHYAGLDERIGAGIEDYKAALTANDKDFAIHVYDGVNHAFNNDTSQARYDKAAADLAWSRTVAFLTEKIG